MRQVGVVLRLHFEGLSARQISLSLGVARSTVAECLRRAVAAGIGWPPPPELDETMLERRLYPPSMVRADARPAVDWAALHAELSQYVPVARVAPGHLGFAVPLQLRMPHGELRLMTTITSFATAVDVTLSELKLEAFLPADQATAAALSQEAGPG